MKGVGDEKKGIFQNVTNSYLIGTNNTEDFLLSILLIFQNFSNFIIYTTRKKYGWKKKDTYPTLGIQQI